MELTLIQKAGSSVVPVSGFRLQTGLKTAGILEWETPCREAIPEEGDGVRLGDIFYGYVFQIKDTGRLLQVLCYDQRKYLLYRDTRQFRHKTAGEILREILKERELKAGKIAETGVRLPDYLCENQRLLDMVLGAMEETRLAGGKEYVLFDDCGALTLVEAGEAASGVLLCGENQLTGYEQSKDIDGGTYTCFKLLQEDRRSGFRRVLEGENREERKKWGALQYFEQVDHSWNEAQVRERLRQLQETYRQSRESLEVTGIGDPACLAGRTALCQLPGESKAGRYLITESVLNWTENRNRMRLKLRKLP